MNKKILITGAGGFAGKNLSEYFTGKDGYDVLAARHADLDLLDEGAVKKYLSANKPDLIIHCANCGGTRKTGYDLGSTDVVSRNLRMFFNLARALPSSSRLINLGSGAEYDKRAYEPKMPESFFDSHVPADAYGYSKYVIAKFIDNVPNMVSLRIFGLFGKYEDYTYRFISNAIVKNLLGLPIVINQNVRFDYMYVDDLVRLVENFIEHEPKFRHYNATPSNSIDLVSLAELVNRISKRPSEITVLNPGMNLEYTGHNARVLSEFPGFEFTPYEAAITELYAYYRSVLATLDIQQVKKDSYLKDCRAR